MKSGEDIIAVRPVSAEPLLNCPELPAFLSEDLETVRRAFCDAPRVSLRQAWRNVEEYDFAPAEVRIGWRGKSLLVFAELSDSDIFNHATDHNQQTWLLGDTFEIFLRGAGASGYVELHVTPNNHRLQLRYDDSAMSSAAKLKGCAGGALLPAGAFESRVWVQPEIERWCVYAEIPAALVDDGAQALSGRQWRFSFGRYDYERLYMRAVLSSSSAHAEPGFHRQQEWRTLLFVAASSDCRTVTA